ncbi:hypothetical protein Glove_362g26 [Diversispora epigaea]|uniref:Uncharacterized protein n=1 Tax=Diversispora epigaea TaxID=1348612 RepID=A0A397HDK2_9GLOM|nr:hypothetical protein Glove_362g26 [Diversispora epigaea]
MEEIQECRNSRMELMQEWKNKYKKYKKCNNAKNYDIRMQEEIHKWKKSKNAGIQEWN